MSLASLVSLPARMFVHFFLVILSFWILKPLKKGMFIQHYDVHGLQVDQWLLSAAQAELIAKVLNVVVALGAAMVFGWLVSRVRKTQVTPVLATFFVGCLLWLIHTLGAPTDTSVWAFYLFGDLFSTVMVAAFFVRLNDSVTPDQAKRTYGIVGAGGVMGGVVGASLTGLFRASPVEWLWGCAAMTVLVGVIGSLPTTKRDNTHPAALASETPRAPQAGGAMDGAMLVLRSRYLLSIVGIVTLYELVSTIMDFQFSATVAHYLQGDAIGTQFSRVYAIGNVASLVVQLFVTRFVMRRYGVKSALLVLPVAVMFGSVGFGALPILWMGSFLNTADSAFSYSIHQSAKESLYVPTSWDEKSKAKAFIDMFVLRFAKALAVALTLGFTLIASDFSAVRWLSVVTVALALIWIAMVRYVGDQFDTLADTLTVSKSHS